MSSLMKNIMNPEYRDCIHSEVCYHLTEYGECDCCCSYYKSEDRFIESPVAVGSTVYIRVRTDRKDPSQFFINPAKVTGLHLRDEVGHRGIARKEYFIVRSEYGMAQHIPFDKIGKTVFFTREEAMHGSCSKEICSVRYE